MSKWKNRPIVHDNHPFKELYDKMLDMNKDELIDTIHEMIEDRKMAIKMENEGRKGMNIFIAKEMFENAIETYYWKFINKDTRVDDGSEGD